MTHPLTLSPDDSIARGMQRAVYLHPTDDTKLIKVLLPDPDTAGRSRFGNFMESRFPSARTRHIRKEYLEHVRVMLANQNPDFQPPISHMYGFVSTTLGLGCISEKIVTPDGDLADTLYTLINEDRLTQQHIDLLNDTTKRLYALNIRASDLKARNFVFGHRLMGGKKGSLECVLIDGFGDIHAIPIRSWGRWFNRIGLDDSCRRMTRRIGLVWDSKRLEFHLESKH